MGDYSNKTLETLKTRIMAEKSIPEANKQAALDMLSYMRAKGAKTRTLDKHLYCFEKFILALGSDVEILKATRTDLERAIAKIEESGLSEETKRNIKVVVKSFYKHFIGEDLYYPKQIAWVKTTVKKTKKMLPEDILDEGDILKMLKVASNPRDKAIIALLYDSGIRVGELITLRKKDVDINTNLSHITVNGKTGMRRIPVWFSVPYLSAYLNTIEDLKSGDLMWKTIGSWSNTGRKVDEGAVRKLLKTAARKAGLDKRVYPHLFRHSRASNYANKLTEQQLKAFFGWTGDSRMASTYVHLSGRDIDNAILQANGMKPKEEEIKPKLIIRICQRCRMDNSVTATFCSRCGAALDISIAMKQIEKDRDIEEMGSKKIHGEDLEEETVSNARKKKGFKKQKGK